MKSVFALIGAVVISTQAQAAPVITFTPGSSTSAVSGTVIQNFDSFAPNAPIGTNAFAHGGSSGSAARPAFGSTGNFASVHTDGSYGITFGPARAFSFVLGSLDTYNTLTLAFADGTSQSFAGSAITNGGPANGDQTSPLTNGVVKFAAGSGPSIVGATFLSSQDSFEFDNLAVSVPEPATWALMIAGFGLVGASMRRRSMAANWAL